MFIVFRVDDLVAAHCADALLVCAALAVVRADLVDLLLADTALLELGGQWVEPIFPCSKELILSYLPPARRALGARVVARTSLPRVRINNLVEEKDKLRL